MSVALEKTVDFIRSIFQKSLDLIPKTSVSVWADNYRMLPSSSAEPGRWRTDRAPYQKEIMDAFTEKGVRKVVVKSASQVGKSDIMNNVIGRFAHLDPCPIMMIQPTIVDGEDYSKSRIAPMIRATPILRRIFKESKSRDSSNTIMTKYFVGGRLVITGANSPSSLASKPIRILLCDEVDRFPESAGSEGDPVDLASKRTTTYWNRVIGLFSTPTVKNLSRIDDEYMTGTQAEWQHKCPNCGEWHLLTHRQMKPDYIESENKKKEKHIIVKSVVWVCPDCGFSFTEAQMRRILAADVWTCNKDAAKDGPDYFYWNMRDGSHSDCDIFGATYKNPEIRLWSSETRPNAQPQAWRLRVNRSSSPVVEISSAGRTTVMGEGNYSYIVRCVREAQ